MKFRDILCTALVYFVNSIVQGLGTAFTVGLYLPVSCSVFSWHHKQHFCTCIFCIQQIMSWPIFYCNPHPHAKSPSPPPENKRKQSRSSYYEHFVLSILFNHKWQYCYSNSRLLICLSDSISSIENLCRKTQYLLVIMILWQWMDTAICNYILEWLIGNYC